MARGLHKLLLAGLLVLPGGVGAQVVISEFMAVNDGAYTNREGLTPDWIELYNTTATNVSLAGWCLTDAADKPAKWTCPAWTIPAHGFVLVIADGVDSSVVLDELHANFKLDGGGEYLGLSRPDGTVASAFSPAYPEQTANISYGMGEGGEARYFRIPTPNGTNVVGLLPAPPPPTFSAPAGFCQGPFALTLAPPAPGVTVTYTLDGTAPTPSHGTPYGEPLPVERTTVVRAIAWMPDAAPSPCVTRTYLFMGDVLRQSAAPSGFPSTWGGAAADYAMDPRIVTSPAYSNQMAAALLSLPTLSIVTPNSNLFSATDGIYANPLREGVEWERPASIEWIDPAGGKGFQVNAGLRIYGGAGRSSLKKTFRVLFKKEYGPAALDFPLFDEGATTRFDSLVLRSNYNDGFSEGGTSALLLRDEYARRLHLSMGGVAAHGTFVHLYLNGLYWGLYNPTERPDTSFSATYFGGDKDEWDGIHDIPTGESTADTWNQMLAACTAGLSANADYQKIQGNNPDGSRNPAYTNLLDVHNNAQYMLANIWLGPDDWPWHNFYTGALRGPDGTGFKFYLWDVEDTMGIRHDLYSDVTGANIGVAVPYAALRANEEYRLLFGDHVQRCFFNGGPLQTPVVTALFTNLARSIELAILGETARWGDLPPYVGAAARLCTPQNWTTACGTVRANFMPYRSARVLQQLKAAGLYPTVEAPMLLVNGLPAHGGVFAVGAVLAMAASNTVYYTLDGSDPRQYGTGVAVGTPYAGELPLVGAVEVKARARTGAGIWSALSAAVYTPEAPSPLRLTELMHQPRGPDDGGTNWTGADFEFIELQNTSGAPIGLSGLRFTEGITFDFAQGGVRTLGPNAYVLIVKNRAAFASRHPGGASLTIAGEYQRVHSFPIKTLANGGEEVRLEDGVGRTVVRFTYGDGRGWPPAAGGAGHSLVPLDVGDQTEALDYGGNWRASAFVDGSPGAADPEPAREVVLNELVAHTDYDTNALPLGYDSNDSLELFNPGTSAVSLAGWYLSDRADNLRQWAIPPTNVLAQGAWIVFDEIHGFHSPITNGFGLNKGGETVFLSHLPGGGRDRVVDAVRFKGQENGVSLGRVSDGEPYWYALPPTPAAANAAPVAGVVISEFMYHPASAEPGAADEALAEFIEIHNASSVTADLWSADGPWRIDGGVAYTFPAGTQLVPGERAVLVGFDPASNSVSHAAFLERYGLTSGQVRLLGPYGERLDNHGERLALEKPLAPDLPGEPLVWVIVDETIYFDRAPWPADADGTGRSLQRAEPMVSGCNPANWYAAWVPTPGCAAERVVLSAPADEAVVFVQMDEPLQAAVESSLVAGLSPQVGFFLDDALVGTDASAPYAATVRLPAAGRYRLRAELTDAAGVWTSRTAWVTALALSNAVVTAPDDTGATVAGALAGAAPAVVRVHWGSDDGGTNAGAWTFSAAVGTISNAAFTTALGSLQAGRTYAVRFSATVGGRVGWSPAATTFTTPAYAQWPYGATIRLSGDDDAEPLHDFPVLVRLSTNLSGFAYSQLGGSWTSLRFTDATGTQPLAYEVDVWDTNAESAIWVCVPALTNGTTLRAQWGRAGVTNPAPFAVRGAVWPAEDEAVWHWQDGLRDATWRGREAVDRGSSAAAGIVGAGRTFDGVDDELDPTVEAGWYATNLPALTISLWVKPAATPAMYATAFGADATNAALYVAMQTNPRVLQWLFGVGNKQFTGPAYDIGAWQLLSLALSNGTAYAQKNDGPMMALGSFAPFALTNAPVLGRRAGVGYPWAGSVDEVRISRAARSGAWLRAAYRTVAQHASVTAYGPVVAASGDLDGDRLPDAWEHRHFGNTARSGDADWDADGMLDRAEFVAGTDPTNAASRFTVSLAGASNAVTIGFHAVRGEPGSEGWTRVYALEGATGLIASAWWGIPGHTNLTGFSGEVLCTNASPQGAIFYRGNVWLIPESVPP